MSWIFTTNELCRLCFGVNIIKPKPADIAMARSALAAP